MSTLNTQTIRSTPPKKNPLRSILHSDLNCFFASVEIALHPELRGKCVAVCGSQEDRHGIVLAKSEGAKRYGVKTGMANWQAQQVCPQLVIVPPHYESYQRYSRLVQNVYRRYTDLVEPFGLDECWLDVSNSNLIYGNGLQIAESIRQTVKREFSLTVSIGVSYNKVFAKLGSDMKKPDAITVLPPESLTTRIWPLPVSDLLFVGRATTRKLNQYGIRTIGDLAQTPTFFLKRLLGKNGLMLWNFANGLDQSRVMPISYQAPVKSLSHGTTCRTDLHRPDEVWPLILHLMQTVASKLWRYQLCARGVSLTVRDNNLYFHSYQAPLEEPTQSPNLLARSCWELFARSYAWSAPIRAITVGATKLQSSLLPRQLSLFEDPTIPLPDAVRSANSAGTAVVRRQRLDHERHTALNEVIEEIRSRFGKRAIHAGTLLTELPVPKIPNESRLPGMMFT